jgi:hypothetical protein
MASASGVLRQPTTHTQLNQHRPPAALGSPLPPQRRPKAPTNPASQADQLVRRFAESEIATPTPYVRSQGRHRRLQAHAFGLPCDFPNPFLKPLDGLRREPVPNVWTVDDTEFCERLTVQFRGPTHRNIYVRSENAGQRVMESVKRFITKRLKLRVNEQKSAVAPPQVRKFLGFSFTDGPGIRRTLAAKAVHRFKDRVRDITRRARSTSLEQTIGSRSLSAGPARLFRVLRKRPMDWPNSRGGSDAACGQHYGGNGRRDDVVTPY